MVPVVALSLISSGRYDLSQHFFTLPGPQGMVSKEWKMQ